MFYNFNKITSLKVFNDSPKIFTNIVHMFDSCKKLNQIYLTNILKEHCNEFNVYTYLKFKV